MRSFTLALLLWAAPLGYAAANAATCTIITYFSDAAMTQSVGTWSNCPGQKGLHGKRSKYSERETEQLRSPAPGPGGLPCDFLAKGCSAVPQPR